MDGVDKCDKVWTAEFMENLLPQVATNPVITTTTVTALTASQPVVTLPIALTQAVPTLPEEWD
jgi:hypothetical protein